ncbi:MAG: hypothetical protein ACT4OX_13100 [Actinomycetota bacterium]
MEVATAESFESFAAQVEPSLRRALVAWYGTEVGAEATADAMAVAWERWAEIQPMANPAGYLFRVAQSHTRRYRRRPVLLPIVVPVDLPDVDPRLPDALARLSPRQRAAVLLVHAHDCAHASGDVFVIDGHRSPREAGFPLSCCPYGDSMAIDDDGVWVVLGDVAFLPAAGPDDPTIYRYTDAPEPHFDIVDDGGGGEVTFRGAVVAGGNLWLRGTDDIVVARVAATRDVDAASDDATDAPTVLAGLEAENEARRLIGASDGQVFVTRRVYSDKDPRDSLEIRDARTGALAQTIDAEGIAYDALSSAAISEDGGSLWAAGLADDLGRVIGVSKVDLETGRVLFTNEFPNAGEAVVVGHGSAWLLQGLPGDADDVPNELLRLSVDTGEVEGRLPLDAGTTWVGVVDDGLLLGDELGRVAHVSTAPLRIDRTTSNACDLDASAQDWWFVHAVMGDGSAVLTNRDQTVLRSEPDATCATVPFDIATGQIAVVGDQIWGVDIGYQLGVADGPTWEYESASQTFVPITAGETSMDGFQSFTDMIEVDGLLWLTNHNESEIVVVRLPG